MAHVCSSVNTYVGKAPGSLMLLGEHAVLHQKQAVVLAIQKYMSAEIIPRKDKNIHIFSSLGNMETTLEDLNHVSNIPDLQFVIKTLQYFQTHIPTGFELSIESEFTHTLGFGSSAAVVVAIISALNKFCNLNFSPSEIFLHSRTLVQAVQGRASGADVAASVFGGVLVYRAEPFEIRKLEARPHIQAIYSGYKTKTIDVIQKVQARFQHMQALFESLITSIEHCTVQAISALEKSCWNTLGECMNVAQGYLNALGVSDETLESFIYQLRQTPGIYGAKISGAGLGDCVIGLGQMKTTKHKHTNLIPIEISEQGCC